jgi:uncharacterized membrane protein
LASELGILSHSAPILITTFKTVYPGTHGAVSLGGTLASLGGGAIIGFTLAASLILESSKCREQWIDIVIVLFVWGTIAGGLGSLVSAYTQFRTAAVNLHSSSRLTLSWGPLFKNHAIHPIRSAF